MYTHRFASCALSSTFTSFPRFLWWPTWNMSSTPLQISVDKTVQAPRHSPSDSTNQVHFSTRPDTYFFQRSGTELGHTTLLWQTYSIHDGPLFDPRPECNLGMCEYFNSLKEKSLSAVLPEKIRSVNPASRRVSLKQMMVVLHRPNVSVFLLWYDFFIQDLLSRDLVVKPAHVFLQCKHGQINTSTLRHCVDVVDLNH